MAEGSRPPQFALMASAAGGGFGGALIAILVAKILMGSPCCCDGQVKRAAQVDLDSAENTVLVAESR